MGVLQRGTTDQMLSWQIGDVRISQLVEITDGSGTLQMLPAATPENLERIPWLRPHFVTRSGKLLMNIQMLIIETPDYRMVVDTCVGNDKALSVDGWAGLQLPFLESLGDLGYSTDSIDRVICTHLHVDHVGWNTRRIDGRWVPTFDKARYMKTVSATSSGSQCSRCSTPAWWISWTTPTRSAMRCSSNRRPVIPPAM
jgi:hypothetical protein